MQFENDNTNRKTLHKYTQTKYIPWFYYQLADFVFALYLFLLMYKLTECHGNVDTKVKVISTKFAVLVNHVCTQRMLNDIIS